MNKTEFWLMNNPLRRLSLRFEVRKLRQLSPAQNLQNVLEIGCGEGQGTRNILRYWQPQKITAIDLDPKMINRAKARVKDPRVTFNVADAADLSFAKTASYDAVFDFGIIHHVPNWQKCLQELHRVLKPGGYLHLEDLSIESFTSNYFSKFLRQITDHPYDKMYTKMAFEKQLEKLGFTTIKTAELKTVHAFWKVVQK